jgi:hypothetical protein
MSWSTRPIPSVRLRADAVRAFARTLRVRAAGLLAVSTLAASALAAAPVSRALAAQSTTGAAGTASATARSERTVTSETPDATRAELTLLLETEQKRAADAAAKPADRDKAKAEVEAIRRRLEAGDFRAGDRFIALVVADSVRRMEMVVREGPSVDLAPLPVLSLQGLLRSELQPAVLQHFARFYRNPEVRIDFLTRVTVTGAVAKPGVVAVPPDALVGDVLMAAGGPLASANMDKVEILRNGRTILDRKKFQQATKDGVTLDRLGIRPGDEFKVAERGRRNWAQVATITMLSMTALTAILSLIRSSYSD